MAIPRQNIALYGGSFDPVHLGHLAVARAAAERFHLDRIYFVPADVQPMKAQQKGTNFYHRYAMLTLALADEPAFLPSLLEAPEIVRATGHTESYSVDTVARLRQRLETDTRLYFLIGMDAFAQIAYWRAAAELLHSVEFIVSSRPGFPLSLVSSTLPQEFRPSPQEVATMQKTGVLRTHGATIHLLPDVNETVSATAIRDAARRREGLEKLVPDAVAAYITKLKLYDEGEEEPGSPEPPRF